MSGPSEEYDAEAVFGEIFTDADIYNWSIVFKKKLHLIQPKEITNPEKVLYDNKRYQECILYIESLENFYSDYYITYLIKAYVSMGNYSSARAEINLYASSKVDDEAKDETRKCLNEVIKRTQTDELYTAGKMLDSQLTVHNLCYEINQGHLIASQNIKMGETILLEKPMLSIGKGKCSHCFRNSVVGICCKICNSIFYCSKYCKSKDKNFHQWECSFYKIFSSSAWNKCVLRIFLKELQNGFKNNGMFVEVNDFYDSTKQRPQYKFSIENSLLGSLHVTAYIMGQTELKKLILQTELFANCPENKLKIKLGGTILKIHLFCTHKAVSIFDNILGTSLEIYSTLSNVKFSCKPNAIISRTSNKIVLKANQEVQKGEEIHCAYFDIVVNTTFLDVLLENGEEMSGYCKYFCGCNKSQYDYNSNHEDEPLIPAHLLKIIRNCDLENNDFDINSIFKTANECILDKNNLLLQGIYFEVIKHEMCLDNFDNVCLYLPVIMNTSCIQFFKWSHMEICSSLMRQSVIALAKFPLHNLEILIDYLKFLEEDVYPRYPYKILLVNVKIMKSHYILTKEMQDLPKKAPVA